MASPIANSWVYATVLIKNEWGHTGTGFIVSREIEKGKAKIFLCTNKHVLNKDKELRDKAKHIICCVNIKENNGNIIGKNFTVELIASDGTKIWREYPDEDIDVLVFDITGLIIQHPEIEKKWADYSTFATKDIINSQEITIGEEVFIIGYPLTKKQGETNFPLVRQGIIATKIGDLYVEEYTDKDGTQKSKKYRGFLVDGGVIPGSSGSPVVLKPIAGRLVGNSIMMNLPPPYLLGIISETRYCPIKEADDKYSLSFAGLGLAFDASTVRETIELFFK